MSEKNERFASLLGRIERRDYQVAIVGMGYVGLPLGLAFLKKKFRVLGIDVDQRKVEMLNRGESYLHHIPTTGLVEQRRLGYFDASSDFERLRGIGALQERPADPAPAGGQAASESQLDNIVQRLSRGVETAPGIWVQRIEFENPR